MCKPLLVAHKFEQMVSPLSRTASADLPEPLEQAQQVRALVDRKLEDAGSLCKAPGNRSEKG